MLGKLKLMIIAMTAFSALALAPLSFAIDLDQLEARGEVYAVALYTGYQSEANYLDRIGRERAANFMRTRAEAVVAGAELFPLHPTAFSTLDEDNERALMSAHNETFALVGLEAADVAPNHIAAVQIAYEVWLFGAGKGIGPLTDDGRNWRLALGRFVDWSESSGAPALSANERALPITMSGGSTRTMQN